MKKFIAIMMLVSFTGAAFAQTTAPATKPAPTTQPATNKTAGDKAKKHHHHHSHEHKAAADNTKK